MVTSKLGWVVAVLVAAGGALGPGMARGATDIYVCSNNGWYGSGSVGKYNLDGTAVNTSLLSGLYLPAGIAVSGTDLYVAEDTSGVVGKYTTSGAVVNDHLITGIGNAQDVAVSGANVFVLDAVAQTIGEYSTSGAVVNRSLITGLSNSPACMAVADGYIYVTNQGNNTVGKYSISGATANAAFISGVSSPFGVTVSGDKVYVGCQSSQRIEEYTTSGALVNGDLVSLATGPAGLGVAGSTLYVEKTDNGGGYGGAEVGSYSLPTGATLNTNFITGLYEPNDLVIADDAVPEPGTVCLVGLGAVGLLGRRRKWEGCLAM